MHDILLVEDDLHLREALAEALKKHGYDPRVASTCEEARAEAHSRTPQFAVLDVGLPDGNGLDLAKEFLQRDPRTKILFLTAFGTPEDRLRGLELGASDYIGKPFHLKELILRLENLVGKPTAQWTTIGKAQVHFGRYLIKNDQGERNLSQKERDLLEYLVRRSPEAVSREDIFQNIWKKDDDELPTTRTIDNYIMRLRKWIEEDPARPLTLLSIWGVGYSLRKEDAYDSLH